MAVKLDLSFDISSDKIKPLTVKNDQIMLELGEVQQVTTSDHNQLGNRNLPDQHPIESITNLGDTLEQKLTGAGYLTNLEIQAILNS